MSTPTESGLTGMAGFPAISRLASRGNRLATLVSAFAFAFSGVSLYETVIKQPKLSIYVPPVLQYGHDDGGNLELFAIPITINNDGARSGTVLAMELQVENLAPAGDLPKSKNFYSAYLGEHSKNIDQSNRAFAPLSVAGRASASETIRFYPQGNPLPHIAQDAGSFRFTLKLTTAVAKTSLFESSLVSTKDSNSLLVITRSGKPEPVPTIRDRCFIRCYFGLGP